MKHSIRDPFPFYHPEAIKFLSSIIKPYWLILETGSGSSTLWFASKAKKVISFEHTESWFYAITKLIVSKKIKNIDLRLLPNYPKDGILGYRKEEFDLIAVDGNLRSRVRSVMTAIPFLKSGGYLLLDDSENKYYKEAVDLLATWESRVFNENFHHETTVWRKP